MLESDLDRIIEIERGSFARPWKIEHFLYEMRDNKWAVNRVARLDGESVGYACLWVIHGELKINNFAVHPDFRRCGIARWMLRNLLDRARRDRCSRATLEVRDSNAAARSLYESEGFVESGRRRGYYAREGEDAIVMEREIR